jgi:hypothetical protein
VEINHLNSVAPWIAEVAFEGWNQLDVVSLCQLISHFSDLIRIAHYDPEMPIGCIRAHVLVLEHREKLMLAEFEKRVAFALIQFLQPKNILIKCDRLFDVAYFNGDVITAVNLHAHDLHSHDIRLLRALSCDSMPHCWPTKITPRIAATRALRATPQNLPAGRSDPAAARQPPAAAGPVLQELGWKCLT